MTSETCLQCSHVYLTVCAECIEGYTLQSETNECLKCPEGCKDCLSMNFCSECEAGYYPALDKNGEATGSCEPCESPCYECHKSS